MTKQYDTLYLDLDNTLFDFFASEKVAVKKIMRLHNIDDSDENASLYSRINQMYWEMFEDGKIEKSEIFAGRFKTLLEKLNISGDSEQMAKDYFLALSCGHDLFPEAIPFLEYIKEKNYTVYATTNGVSKTQFKRVKEADIEKYFDKIFVSEECGFQKPDKRYFEYCLNNSLQKDKSKILIIGDSQSADVLGGLNFGVDVCWLNAKGEKSKYNPKFEIRNLLELKSII